ncbi:YIP1 family protein [Yoonia sp.]|uniref:YIP1 family protein n=1 Tax=Yoonia sp. TaxID=2212373 RepID=UPI002FDB43D2
MTITFQSWMQAVWSSIAEPSDTARKVIAMEVPKQALWTGLVLVAVLNVVLLSFLQFISPAPQGATAGGFVLSPFAYAMIIGVFLVLFVLGTHAVGRFFGGIGTQEATLAIIVWFQAVSLTLEAVQVVLVLISPVIGSLFGLLSLGVLLWVFVNFVNVLHAFDSVGKAIFTIVLALLLTALGAGLVLAALGIGPSGAFA